MTGLRSVSRRTASCSVSAGREKTRDAGEFQGLEQASYPPIERRLSSIPLSSYSVCEKEAGVDFRSFRYAQDVASSRVSCTTSSASGTEANEALQFALRCVHEEVRPILGLPNPATTGSSESDEHSVQLARSLDSKAHAQVRAFSPPQRSCRAYLTAVRSLVQAQHELELLDLRGENAALRSKLDKAFAELDEARVS